MWRRRRLEEKEVTTEWLTPPSLLLLSLLRAPGHREEVMTWCPDAAESHSGMLPASASTSPMRTKMLATSVDAKSLYKRTRMQQTSPLSARVPGWVSKTRITAAGPKLNVCFWNLFENPLQDVKNALASGPERDRVSQLLNNSHCGGKWEVGGLTWGGGCQQPKLWFLLIKPSSAQLSVLLPCNHCNQLTVDHYFCFKDCPFNYTTPCHFYNYRVP